MEQILSDIRTALVAVVATIDGYTPPPPPAPTPPPPPPAPAPAGYVTLPMTYQLFGPVQNAGALSQVPGADFSWQGAALSASTKRLSLGAHVADIEWARAVVIWTPNSNQNQVEIISMDDGPVNIQQLGVVTGESLATPRAGAVDVTTALKALVDAARAANTSHKHIGFRMKGPATYTLFEVRLEVAWKIPT